MSETRLPMKRLEVRDPSTNTPIGVFLTIEEYEAMSRELEAYRASLHALTRDRRVSFSKEELRHLEEEGVSLGSIIDELS